MRRLLILVFIGALLGACDQVASTPGTPTSPAGAAPSAGAYPAPDNGAYPAPAGAYPGPSSAAAASGYPAPSPLPPGPKFTLNSPVRASDTQVSGTGPAGVPIKLIDVARSGETIGETKIGADGTFQIDVGANKLIAGDRIALMLGDTQGTSLNPGDYVSGPGYEDYPQVGILFASTVVQ